jgi:hypothetical protein
MCCTENSDNGIKEKGRQPKRKVLILWSLITIPPFTASLVDLLMILGKQVC